MSAAGLMRWWAWSLVCMWVGPQKHNEARRFITLIDVLYEKRIRCARPVVGQSGSQSLPGSAVQRRRLLVLACCSHIVS